MPTLRRQARFLAETKEINYSPFAVNQSDYDLGSSLSLQIAFGCSFLSFGPFPEPGDNHADFVQQMQW